MKVLSLVFFIVASVVGAGFASGKEIATYFCRFGFLAIPSIVATGVVFYVLIKHCLLISKEKDNFKLSPKYTFLLYSTLVFLGGSMLAGNDVLGDMLHIPCLNLITLLLAGIFVHIGVKSIKRISFVVSPIIFGCIVLLFVAGLDKIGVKINIPITNSPVLSFINVAGYISFNFLLVAMYLLNIGKNYTEKQIKLASFLSSAFIVCLIIVIGFLVMFSKPNIYSSDMPLIKFAFLESKTFGYIMLVVVWIGLLSSLLSCLYSMLEISRNYIKNRFLNLIINLLLILGISQIGFVVIVNYVYLVAGLVGLTFVYKVIKYKRIRV